MDVNITLDADLLRRVGLGELPPRAANQILQDVYDLLEMRVGVRISARANDRQLKEFSVLAERDEDAAMRSIFDIEPDYDLVVSEEFARVEADLRDLVASYRGNHSVA